MVANLVANASAARLAACREARPTKLTPKAAERAIEAARTGATRAQAAAYAGVGERTLYDWLALGEAEDAPPRYRSFRSALARAEAELVVELTGRIRLSAVHDPRLAIGLLKIIEARGPQRVELSGPDGGPIMTHEADDEWGVSSWPSWSSAPRARAPTATTTSIETPMCEAGCHHGDDHLGGRSPWASPPTRSHLRARKRLTRALRILREAPGRVRATGRERSCGAAT
jgi:hypothetical protein